MAMHAIAVRYGRALFDVSCAEADPRTVEGELAGFVELMDRHRELQQGLTNPAVPASKKVAVVKALLDRAPVAPVLARTLELLAKRDRLSLLPELLRDFRRRLLDQEGVVRAEVTTAFPLSPERLQGIERGLASVSGKQVTLSATVDPGVVGGLLARMGGTVYDGTVATQLRRMRDRLVGGLR